MILYSEVSNRDYISKRGIFESQYITPPQIRQQRIYMGKSFCKMPFQGEMDLCKVYTEARQEWKHKNTTLLWNDSEKDMKTT